MSSLRQDKFITYLLDISSSSPPQPQNSLLKPFTFSICSFVRALTPPKMSAYGNLEKYSNQVTTEWISGSSKRNMRIHSSKRSSKKKKALTCIPLCLQQLTYAVVALGRNKYCGHLPATGQHREKWNTDSHTVSKLLRSLYSLASLDWISCCQP